MINHSLRRSLVPLVSCRASVTRTTAQAQQPPATMLRTQEETNMAAPRTPQIRLQFRSIHPGPQTSQQASYQTQTMTPKLRYLISTFSLSGQDCRNKEWELPHHLKSFRFLMSLLPKDEGYLLLV